MGRWEEFVAIRTGQTQMLISSSDTDVASVEKCSSRSQGNEMMQRITAKGVG